MERGFFNSNTDTVYLESALSSPASHLICRTDPQKETQDAAIIDYHHRAEQKGLQDCVQRESNSRLVDLAPTYSPPQESAQRHPRL